jgi:hypothetical protein
MFADDTVRLRDARVALFEGGGLGPDGGYDARWVRFRIGPITIPIPNTKARRRALPLHDLHHIATGYDTSWVGEGEIGAWEIASGCGRYFAAWMLALAAMQIGVLIAPRRAWRAFVRGRQSRTLFVETWDERMLDGSIGALRERMTLDRAVRPARPTDAILFVAWSLPLIFATGGVVIAFLVLGRTAV